MICGVCGANNKDEAKFCYSCGSKLEAPAAPAPSPAPAPTPSPTPAPAPQPAQVNVPPRSGSPDEKLVIPVDELKKLKELLDKEIITQEEFDITKRKLLDIE